MKKIIKGFVLGVIVTTLIMGTALGAGVKKTIEVAFNSINLTVNGEKIDADNIVYQGTTYVPLRAAGEILGKDVGWNQATQTASINDKDFMGKEKYINARFGFSVEYPEEWDIYEESQNGDGCFLYKDDNVSVSAAAGLLVRHDNYKSYLEDMNFEEMTPVNLYGTDQAYKVSYYDELNNNFVIAIIAGNNGITYQCSAIYKDINSYNSIDKKLQGQIQELQKSFRILSSNAYTN